MPKICIDETLAFTYSFLLICIIIIFIYYISKTKEHFVQVDLYSQLSKDQLVQKINHLQNKLHATEVSKQDCQRTLQGLKGQEGQSNSENRSYQKKFLDKIYNPLTPPENVYQNKYDSYNRYQEIGYLTNETGQFPVFARYKYPGKTDRFEYYTISDSRNRIKIPFNVKNFNELYTDDQVTVPDLGNFTFKKYPDEGLRYDPNNF